MVCSESEGFVCTVDIPCPDTSSPVKATGNPKCSITCTVRLPELIELVKKKGLNVIINEERNEINTSENDGLIVDQEYFPDTRAKSLPFTGSVTKTLTSSSENSIILDDIITDNENTSKCINSLIDIGSHEIDSSAKRCDSTRKVILITSDNSETKPTASTSGKSLLLRETKTPITQTVTASPSNKSTSAIEHESVVVTAATTTRTDRETTTVDEVQIQQQQLKSKPDRASIHHKNAVADSSPVDCNNKPRRNRKSSKVSSSSKNKPMAKVLPIRTQIPHCYPTRGSLSNHKQSVMSDSTASLFENQEHHSQEALQLLAPMVFNSKNHPRLVAGVSPISSPCSSASSSGESCSPQPVPPHLSASPLLQHHHHQEEDEVFTHQNNNNTDSGMGCHQREKCTRDHHHHKVGQLDHHVPSKRCMMGPQPVLSKLGFTETSQLQQQQQQQHHQQQLKQWVKNYGSNPFVNPGPTDLSYEMDFNRLPPNYHKIIDEYSKVCGYDASKDKTLRRTYHLLAEANCYYGRLSVQEARSKLKSYTEGTYLLRDSSDANHLFSLSIKTIRGVTAIRISYQSGYFKLDCDETMAERMPVFKCIMELLEFYTQLTSRQERGNMCVYLESSGRRDTAVVLRKPCVHSIASLKSLARRTLNGMLSYEQRRKLLIFMPPVVEKFMMDYPYSI